LETKKFNDRELFITERGLRGLVSSHGSTYGWGLVGCGCGVMGAYYLDYYIGLYMRLLLNVFCAVTGCVC
jgi:hypothetical protein